ncbi:MAG: hypothetical protein PHX60_14515 [Giesbergeria sp.]|uniref:hypothetical protein n=1 Tax=Giesbergeria sp. TaxID=2818473 RepID=UPI0026372A80|nr:hypothetical protein [Giesbergeria sp.]MDD2610870.1 hypothetical protein [Giesbergeria sp.]
MPPSVHLPTPEQQRLLDRMQAQRQRLLVWQAQQSHFPRRSMGSASNPAALLSSALLGRLAWFARRHPLAVLAGVGVAWAAGPKRLAQWAGVLLPLLLRPRA